MVVPSTTIKRRELISRHLFYLGVLLSDLSVFVDESGTQESGTEYYVVTYVLHDQDDEIAWRFALYEESLARKALPDIPFHATPLKRAHDAYANLDITKRKYLLVSFNMLVQKLPIRYKSFVYQSREFGNATRLQSLIRRDLAAMLVDNLTYFQSFDHVKIYYDQGQAAVSRALEAAFAYALSKEAMVRRESDYRSYRLAQVADYLCEIELCARKYEHNEQTATDVKFYGTKGSFNKKWLKMARRKLMP